MSKRKIGAIELPSDVALSGRLICPNCGDTKFGSTAQPNGELIRTCHGWEGSEKPCAFKWPESEDHKYFFVPVICLQQPKQAPNNWFKSLVSLARDRLKPAP